MDQQSMKRCQICDEWKQEGINLFVSFICTSCEKEMLKTDPEDEMYQFYIDRMKSKCLQDQVN
ncbi:sigma factor G inhibitor Gin [Alkalibacillus aidingensis]|uniref:sigma factor G inhibitor Gin n=1 Tax=Alkalibacillus aidingensis TaxID=2747607 RepID=UPI001660C551|nr:sigma factor G inhibitor Gin [Alkalibacillus aidingensis]